MPRNQDPDYRPRQQYVPTFAYEAESLAQWKMERGNDMIDKSWGFLLSTIVIPPLWWLTILFLPVAIYKTVQGRKLRREGEEEGGEARGWRGRGSESIAPNSWELEVGPHVRRVEAPIRPPAHLLAASDEA